MKIKIRLFDPSDALGLSEVARKSWLFAYSHIFEQETIIKRISRNYSQENILESVESESLSKMFVAEDETKIVGFAQPCYYNYWDPETFNPNMMLLSRIYVLPDYIGKGIGSKLLDVSEKWITDKGFSEYYLYVHKDNVLGRSFYSRKGFVKVKEPNEEGEILLKKVFVF